MKNYLFGISAILICLAGTTISSAKGFKAEDATVKFSNCKPVCELHGTLVENSAIGIGWYDLIEHDGRKIRFNLMTNPNVSQISFLGKDGKKIIIVLNGKKV